jgi:hypothetical protein
MMPTIVSRRTATRTLLFGAISCAALKAFEEEFPGARDLVARVQGDLQRAADFTRNNGKERERYFNVQHHLSEFDRELRKSHFDKDRLDATIDDLKNVVKNNTLESHDRDALAADLADLRTLRDTR